MNQRKLDEADKVIEDAVASGCRIRIQGDFVMFEPPPKTDIGVRLALCDPKAIMQCAEVFLEDLPVARCECFDEPGTTECPKCSPPFPSTT